MMYYTAKMILEMQDKALKKINNTRVVHGGYEYKIVYEGGFSNFIGIYRRMIGKRNFKFFDGFGAYNCGNSSEVYNIAMQKIRNASMTR